LTVRKFRPFPPLSKGGRCCPRWGLPPISFS